MSRRQLRRRYRRILFFGIRLTLSFLGWEIILSRVLGRSFVRRGTVARMQRFAREFRVLAIEMGGVLIKLGQFLSARVDLLPREVTQELVGLQDEVPPEPLQTILAVIESEVGPVDGCFEFFDEKVQAAASLGQVHRARLVSGEPVVVKVQRPGIETLIDVDLAAVRTVARWVGRYPPIRRRMNLLTLLDEFARTLYEELDYLAEARNAETFAGNFASDPFIYVPAPYWTCTTRRVLVLEDVGSIKIVDFEALGLSPSDSSVHICSRFSTMVFFMPIRTRATFLCIPWIGEATTVVYQAAPFCWSLWILAWSGTSPQRPSASCANLPSDWGSVTRRALCVPTSAWAFCCPAPTWN